ncbi:aminotransferase class V-fold PLP-dependent enzyme [Pannus brasiliensis CCIBt3594]|uniref:Aminotransferase class V-fold PLP-dependent enzyme n=1 Tax=Pannus brasiliensis CCIBt3594 TaxID=1427578 RepID=A0AAW9QQY8_9CHRO
MHEDHWLLDRSIDFLNHGSYGATPRVVLEYQQKLRERMESQPLAFLGRDLEGLLDKAREGLAEFVGVNADDLVSVPNATTAVNAVLRSLSRETGDEILITDQTYNACRNAVEYVAGQHGITVIVANVPFPLQSPEQITEAILAKVSPRTKLVLLDHVPSVTALIWPVAEIVRELNRLGIDTLIDGAHALGFLPLDVGSIAPTYYTANCHKWLCSPKGAAFLYVRPDRQAAIRPVTISHGANSPRLDRSRFQLEFGWMGTDDPTAYLSVPRAIEFLESLYPGGLPELWQRNHEVILQAREIICNALQVEIPCPDEMIGSMASIPVPQSQVNGEKLYQKLINEYSIEVPIMPWGEGKFVVRICAHAYNSIDQYERLAECLRELENWR